jgi:hypothetical protein
MDSNVAKIEPRDVATHVSEILDLRVSFEQFQEMWSSIFYPRPSWPIR